MPEDGGISPGPLSKRPDFAIFGLNTAGPAPSRCCATPPRHR